jgi:hypothetical protein
VLEGAVGAWKQPQQLLLFTAVANSIDAVVTLDGFNEHFAYLNWAGRIDNPPFNASLRDSLGGGLAIWRSLATAGAARLFRWQRENVLFSRSRLAYLLFKGVRGKLSHIGNDASWVYGGDSRLSDGLEPFIFPEAWPLERRRNYNRAQYRYYYRAMDAIAAKLHIGSIHFLQPAPAVDKVLTEEEKGRVGDLNYGNSYRDEEADLLGLRKEGSDVNSLLDVYKNETESIYLDQVHPGKHGFEMLHRRIMNVLEKRWALKKQNNLSEKVN